MTSPEAVNSIPERLEAAPAGSDVALILRHAERSEIPFGEFGVDVPLTAQGVSEARRLGAVIRSVRREVSAVSSPVPRCVQTARAILGGGGCPGNVTLDRRLGDPGPFVVAPDISGNIFLKLSIAEIVRRQLHEAKPLPGMRATADGIKLLLSLATVNLENQGRVKVYVTHDAILAVLVASLFRLPLEETGWPQYLQGLLVWRTGGRLHFSWGELQQASCPIGG